MATISSNGTGGGAWSATATWSGGVVPVDDDAVTIVAGDSVLMDTDTSGFTGLRTVTITSHATTPGMLYFKDGTSGYLKLRTGYNIVGTNAAAKGRLLANSNGTWGATGALAFADKAVIDLQGTAKIDAQYLDIALYCTEPTNKYVEVYKTAYTCTTQTTDVNVSTDVITFTSAPPAAGTIVRVKSSGTLPGGLSQYDVYYTRTVSGNTCKLAYATSDAYIVNITSTGSGTLTMYDGHTSTSTATVNVIQDVTGDTPWTTTSGHNRVVLTNTYSGSTRDHQLLTLSTINSGSLVLSANVDSTQYPLARVYLSSRNVVIFSAGTSASQAIADYANANTASGVFNCAIINTGAAHTPSYVYYGVGINYGTGHTIGGCITGCAIALQFLSSATHSGVTVACSTHCLSSVGGTYSGTYHGGGTGISGSVTTFCTPNLVSGEIHQMQNPLQYCANMTFSGLVSGCHNGPNFLIASVFSGRVTSSGNGLNWLLASTFSGTLAAISYIAPLTTVIGSKFVNASIIGCSYGFYNSDFTATNLTLLNSLGTASFTSDFYVLRSFEHNGAANDTRTWSAGGTMTHETTEVPSGKSYSHKFTHTSASYWTQMFWEIDRPSGAIVNVPVWAKHDSTGLSGDQLLRWELIDPASDPILGGTALATWTASDSASWQSSIISYTKTDDRPLLLRVSAKRASGNSYAYVEPQFLGINPPIYAAGVM